MATFARSGQQEGNHGGLAPTGDFGSLATQTRATTGGLPRSAIGVHLILEEFW
ncbi:MAG: hypothetical protein ACO35Q_11595 [Prochlorothrix sp.]